METDQNQLAKNKVGTERDGEQDWWEVSAHALPWLIPIVLAAIVGALAAGLVLQDSDPGDRSADAGFSRDMTTHHAQAVQMAGIVYARTDDPEIRYLAYDILTTQQAQIGMLGAWLDIWELSPTSLELPMTWMGHGMDGPMPGMASDEEVRALETLPVSEMDREFLRLMILHHEGGVDMAEAGVRLAGEDRVRSLAQLIVDSQQSEIVTMQRMLDARS